MQNSPPEHNLVGLKQELEMRRQINSFSSIVSSQISSVRLRGHMHCVCAIGQSTRQCSQKARNDGSFKKYVQLDINLIL